MYLFLCSDVGGQSGASRSAGFQISYFFVSPLPAISSTSATTFQPTGKEKEKRNIRNFFFTQQDLEVVHITSTYIPFAELNTECQGSLGDVVSLRASIAP